ncbi:MAG: GntR family transcriptional regulator [Chloroflexota bacterium]
MPSRPQLPLHVDPLANLPLFAQLRQQIAWLIASGQLEPGDRLPTIRALGDRLGVHMHTIRQTYRRLQQDGLVETRPGKGTTVLPFDFENLRGQNPLSPSHAIGVLMPSMDPFYVPFLDGLEELARVASYLLTVSFTRDKIALSRLLMQQLIAKNVDGLIVVSPVGDVLGRNTPSALPPVVYVDAPQAGSNVVLLDLENSGFQATRHLIQHGHSRIGIITAPLAWPNFRESYRGYLRALKTADLEPDPGLVVESPEFEIEGGYQAAIRMLGLHRPPTALFVSGDLLAVGVVRAMKDSGKRVPQDMAIVSKDNIQFAALIDPPLSTVASPAYEMGVEAMRMLSRLIAGKPLEKKRVVLGTELIARRSCGCS